MGIKQYDKHTASTTVFYHAVPKKANKIGGQKTKKLKRSLKQREIKVPKIEIKVPEIKIEVPKIDVQVLGIKEEKEWTFQK